MVMSLLWIAALRYCRPYFYLHLSWKKNSSTRTLALECLLKFLVFFFFCPYILWTISQHSLPSVSIPSRNLHLGSDYNVQTYLYSILSFKKRKKKLEHKEDLMIKVKALMLMVWADCCHVERHVGCEVHVGAGPEGSGKWCRWASCPLEVEDCIREYLPLIG